MHILVGYKGNNIGSDLLKLAAGRVRAYGGKVSLVTSLPGGEKTSQEQVREIERNLDSLKNTLEKQGIPCECHLLIRGHHPGEDLLQFAQENAVDEILIGVRSRSKVGKLLFSSTAQFVILHAGCPVTTLK